MPASVGVLVGCGDYLRLGCLDLPDGDNIDVVVECFVSLEGLAGPDVGVQGELFPESQVERPEPLADRCHQRGLQTNAVLVNRVNSRLGDSHSSVSLTK